MEDAWTVRSPFLAENLRCSQRLLPSPSRRTRDSDSWIRAMIRLLAGVHDRQDRRWLETERVRLKGIPWHDGKSFEFFPTVHSSRLLSRAWRYRTWLRLVWMDSRAIIQ